jgi:hypothetical protein
MKYSILSLVILGLFVGCGGNSLNGTWRSQCKSGTNHELIFNGSSVVSKRLVYATEDCNSSARLTTQQSGSFKTEGENVIIKWEKIEGLSMTLNFPEVKAKYKVEGNKLTLDGSIYDRK